MGRIRIKAECKENRPRFFGHIISHKYGRDSLSQVIEEDAFYSNLDIKGLLSNIYEMDSQFPHCSYISTLECITPSSEDFDFEGNTGYYRTITALEYAITIMNYTNITLKSVFLYLLKDPINYKRIDEILLKYDPNTATRTVPRNIKEMYKK